MSSRLDEGQGIASGEQTRRALLEKAGLGAVGGMGIVALTGSEDAAASTITGLINVSDYPYFAGTGGNDGQKIQDAIDAADGQNAVVYFPPGTYMIDKELSLPNNAYLKGAGQNKSKLLATSALNGALSMLTNNHGTPTDTTDVVIEDLEIDGNKGGRAGATGHLIYFRGNTTCQRIQLRRLYAHDSTMSGFTLHSCSDSVVVNCEVAQCDNDGIDFWESSQGCRIANNYVHDCKDDFIALNAEDALTDLNHVLADVAITGNVVGGGGGGAGPGNGIRIAGAKRVSVSGNVIFQSYWSGIVINSANSTAAEDISITGNVIKDAGQSGSRGYGIEMNHFDFPVSQADITRVIIADNVIVAPLQHCVVIRGLKAGKKIAQVSISNNVLEDPGLHGIAIESLGDGTEVSDISIDGNTLIGTVTANPKGGFGIICNNPSLPVRRLAISTNQVRSWKYTGISLVGPNHFSHSLTGNTSVDNGSTYGHGIYLKSVDGVSVVGNRCVDTRAAGKTQAYGISLDTTVGTSLVTANDASGNVTSGIQRVNLNATTYTFENVGDDSAIKRHLAETTIQNWTPGAINNGAAAATTMSVPNASMGDTVSVSFSLVVPARALLVGAVTATDTVTVTLYNITGNQLTLGAGTLRADVWKH